ncbi:MAG TPA: hypothetical protein RMF84_19600, partial [Polyangiaceae bacterium LLY-WYZ-14_1]|nr:hypothetical protein [Polyangiaceae bacterium LLY-WYZ-14_1]
MFARQGFSPFLAGLFFVVAEGLSGCGDGGEIEEAPDQDGGPGEVDAGPAVVTLTVVLEGRGSGTVESDDVDIVGGDQLRCGFEEDEICSVQVVEGTTVLLEAQPTPPSRFGSFDSPACEIDDQACLARIGTEDLVIEVSFLLGEIQLDVTVDGDGDGTVTSEPAGIDCGENCGSPFDEDEDVTLTASPDEASSEFLGWSGDCADAGMNATCTLEGVDSDLDVGAAFGLRAFETTAMVLGAGAGSVVEDTSGIDCPDDTCQGTATFGDRLRFVATPAANAVVASWGGACAGTPAGNACSVTVEGDVAVTVTFELRRWTVTVDPTGGTGDGTVTGTPGSIDCSTDTPGPVGTCTASITDGETVILTPTAVAATSSFEGWTGCDREVAEACEVDVTSARSVTASFDLLPRDLVVATGGTGSGEVTVTPTGGSAIACADRCTETLLHGTVVTLTAAPNASTSSFDGWTGGGCTGTAACTVTMDVARSVTATFTLLPRDLVVNAVGTGSGTVTVTPAG